METHWGFIDWTHLDEFYRTVRLVVGELHQWCFKETGCWSLLLFKDDHNQFLIFWVKIEITEHVNARIWLTEVWTINVFWSGKWLSFILEWTRGKYLLKFHFCHSHEYPSNEYAFQIWVIRNIYSIFIIFIFNAPLFSILCKY